MYLAVPVAGRPNAVQTKPLQTYTPYLHRIAKHCMVLHCIALQCSAVHSPRVLLNMCNVHGGVITHAVVLRTICREELALDILIALEVQDVDTSAVSEPGSTFR